MSGTRCRGARLAIAVLAVAGLGAAGLQSAQARSWFDRDMPTYVAPPPYYAYARPASYSGYTPTPAVAGPLGFGAYHWQ